MGCIANMGSTIEKLLNFFAVKAFPAILILVTGLVLTWQITNADEGSGLVVKIQAVEDIHGDMNLDQAFNLTKKSDFVDVFATKRSTNKFWVRADVPNVQTAEDVEIEFPSRHASSISCWSGKNGNLLGSGDRKDVSGDIFRANAGFALRVDERSNDVSIVCSMQLRGPGKISAKAWEGKSLAEAQDRHDRIGTLIEAGIGFLALFMLLTAAVNGERLYWTFVGWLLLNMRMAALSAGTDFGLFGYQIDPSILIDIRKATITAYFATTIALFGLLFKEELDEVKTKGPLL